MTLQLYILRQLAVSIGFALAGISVMVLPAITIQAVYKLEGAPLRVVLDYLPLVVVELVPYFLPVAFLLGVVATFGRLAADNEWTAVRMAGIHPLRTFLPGVGIAVIFAFGTHHLLTQVTPEWKFAKRTAISDAEKDAFRSLARGRNEFEIGDEFSLSADSRDSADVFRNVIINVRRSDDDGEVEGEGTRALLFAERVALEFPDDENVLIVYFYKVYGLKGTEDMFNEVPILRIPLDDLVRIPLEKRRRPKYMTNTEIRRWLDGDGSAELKPNEREAYVYEIHQRRALSFTYLIFLLLGAPTGLLLRSGTQLAAFTAAVSYAFLYYVLSMRLGKELVAIGVLGSLFSAWATNLLYLGAGLVLMRRVLGR